MIIGLTGGIATGKSTVSKMLLEWGYSVIDADTVARDVLKKGTEAYFKVIQVFTEDILLENGEINRRKLGQDIFANSEMRMKLNQIVHPIIKIKIQQKINEHLNRGDKVIFVDVPLLYENHYEALFDEVIVVYAPIEVQIKRLMTRNQLFKEEAVLRIQAQMDTQEKAERTEYVVHNSGKLEDTEKQLRHILKLIIE